ncbi:MAG: hypothetical protein OXP09_12410 [Gammaproteobacteria bacterium]|nr:hypothetical protein [Gammaproteobacteria bacterium]
MWKTRDGRLTYPGHVGAERNAGALTRANRRPVPQVVPVDDPADKSPEREIEATR